MAEKCEPTVQIAWEACRERLRARRDFALNATNTVRATRAKWIDLSVVYGARIEFVYLEPPLPRLLAQNRNREHSVPESVMDRLLEKLMLPTRVDGLGVRLVG